MDGQDFPASCRTDVFPPDTLIERESGEMDIGTWSMHRMQGKLHEAGMPAGQALCFVGLLWRCWVDLGYSPKLYDVAADCGTGPDVLSKMLNKWLTGGLVTRRRSKYKGQYYYSFPCHEPLMERVRRYYLFAKIARIRAATH